MQNSIPVLSISGLVDRPIDTCDVVRLNSPDDAVELAFHGPEGDVTLTGKIHDVYRLIVSIELALRDLVLE